MISIRVLLVTLVAFFFATLSSSAFVVPRGHVHPTRSISHYAQQTQSQPNILLQSPPLFMSSSDSPEDASTKENKLPMLLDIGTKGGALFLSLVLFIVPIIFYQIITNLFGVDGIEAGKWIGVGFTAITTVLWVSSYIFRVATKDMTYAKQLKDYENAVIAKRLEELDEDEVQALVEDIERDDF